MHRTVPLIAILLAAPAFAQTPPPTETCRADALFRQQDFTLGHWDVFNGEKKTAEVTMTLTLNDCVIEERWTVLDAARGGNGVGLFNYSPLLKNWGYYWATDTGATTSFRGSLIKPGEMRYVTERPLPNGKFRLRHWTLFANPDGTIRELSVGTEDGGATWITEYDLKWVRHR
ncbi:hypothetical protein [Sandarakinorhabdus oryzae]|uniref:hypothetical protein n=1 Tax=Sandarakinorhabdus oryzae TaxID=2675220 RepID=UPI0012E1EBD9|nr:hypothetical protein [Sandarakinorhabdus oryzae]